MIFLIDIGFLNFSIWDVVDILVVGYLIYQVYRLLRGSVAFNIFVGVVLLYVIWWLVKALKMELLSLILGQFVSVGVLVIAIVFQPELRRFLLILGNQTLKGRLNLLNLTEKKTDIDISRDIHELKVTLMDLSKNHIGALIVLAKNMNLQPLIETGVALDAEIKKPLLQSIFNKESPLHDGAVIIDNQRIRAASCILPLSENKHLPPEAGLRHRAAVGVSEMANVAAFVVSEENGRISMAWQGNINFDLSENQLIDSLEKHY
jgi:diadenylate cyclase